MILLYYINNNFKDKEMDNKMHHEEKIEKCWNLHIRITARKEEERERLDW